MAFFVSTPPVIGAPGDVHTTQQNPLGTIAKDDSGNEYIYLQGATNVADGSWVSYIAGAFVASLLAAGAKGSVAISSGAIGATAFGWFLISGQDTAVCESSILSNAHCFATGTAGEVDDAVVKNDQVKRARTVTAGVAGATATVAIDRPFIGSHDESA